jgi:Protein of unknown function (DUF3379)
MMDHAQYRRSMLADPFGTDPEREAHRVQCEDCRAFTESVITFEQRLVSALKVTVPTGAKILPFNSRAAARPANRRWLALAASVAMAFVAAGIWLTPRASLAADVVSHMAEEPAAWESHATLSAGEIAPVLKRADMTLNPDAGSVSYANSCRFRGHVVPHLVVQSPNGPVTVMVLIHESVAKARQFDEQGYRGTILPMPHHGSIAVLMKESGTTAAEIEAIAAQVRSAIVWGSSG